MSEIFLGFLEFRTFIACCFFHAFSCIFSSLFEIFFCRFGFVSSISSNCLFSFLFCLFSELFCLWFQRLFGLFGSFFKFFFGFLDISFHISSCYLANLISNVIHDIAGTLLQVFPTVCSSILNIFDHWLMGLHSYRLFCLLFSFFKFPLGSFFHITSTLFDIYCAFFDILFGLFGLLLSLWWNHFMYFFCSCFINLCWDLFYFFPSMRNCFGYSADQSFGFLLHFLCSFL